MTEQRTTYRDSGVDIDAKMKAPDGYEARALVMLSSSHLYVLFVHSKTGTDTLFDAFDASFVVQSG